MLGHTVRSVLGLCIAVVALGLLAAPAAAQNRVAFWVEKLSDPEVRTRRQALMALGIMGPEAHEAVSEILIAMNDENDEIRWRAEYVIGRIGPAAVPALVRALSNQDVKIRRNAAFVLGPIGPRAADAVPALLAALDKTKDADARVWMVQALGDIGADAKETIPTLSVALKDPDPDIRRVAVVGLGQMGPKAASMVSLLEPLLKDEHADMRYAAAVALARIQTR